MPHCNEVSSKLICSSVRYTKKIVRKKNGGAQHSNGGSGQRESIAHTHIQTLFQEGVFM